MYRYQYHGTSKTIAAKILPRQISVSFGGGELGLGFYTGSLIHQAFNWAEKKYGVKEMSVIVLDYDDDEFLKLDPLMLNQKQTIHLRRSLKNRKLTRSFKFKRNAILAPIVGKNILDFNQIKYESKLAEAHINSKKYSIL